jgi:hypothetical protein
LELPSGMERARTKKPYLVGLTLLEEMEMDICVEEVDERTLKVYSDFSSEQPTSITLKRIIKSKIQELVLGYRTGTQDEHANQEKTNEKPKEEDKDNTECQWCNNSPCVWDSNRNGIVEWDENEHGHLVGNEKPSNSTRREYLYPQMALTISEGPLGKGHIIVVKHGICTLLPEVEGHYMGHKDE